MRDLEDVANLDTLFAIARHGKSYRVIAMLIGNSLALAGISQVAEPAQLVVRGHELLVRGRGAESAPAVAQRQPCAVRPGAVVKSFCRDEVRTSHKRGVRDQESEVRNGIERILASEVFAVQLYFCNADVQTCTREAIWSALRC